MPVTRRQIRDIAMAFPGAGEHMSYGGKPVRLKRATPKLVSAPLERRFRAIATKTLLAEWEAQA